MKAKLLILSLIKEALKRAKASDEERGVAQTKSGRISCEVTFFGLSAQNTVEIAFYKNGFLFHSAIFELEGFSPERALNEMFY